METSESEKFDANILIEAKLLEQEHRPTHLVLNYINRKKKFPNEDDPRRKAVQRAIIWRLFFSPAVLAVGGSSILGFFTIVLLNKQNNIIEQQTNILNEQNRKIEIQANLEDANRRNNLVFLMDNVLNRIADELKDSKNKDSSLSKALLARIQALGQGFQPYKFIDYTLKDSLNRDSLGLTKLYSPERGQLLLSLANSGIGKETLDSIYAKTSFDSAYLVSARLSNTYLVGVDLNNAYLFGADLSKAILHRVDLTRANLQQADLREVNLGKAYLSGANLKEAYMAGADLFRIDLKGANLRNANLSEVDLFRADLRGTNLQGVHLYKSDMREAILHKANLKGADLQNADLEKADLFYADLSGANLEGANLRKADLRGYDIYIKFKTNGKYSRMKHALTRVNLKNVKSIDSCRVDRKDWLIYIRDSLKLKGAKVLAEKYKVEEYKYGDFIIVKK